MATGVNNVVVRLLQMAHKHREEAANCESDYYNDASTHESVADELMWFAKELLPEFECYWCKHHAGLEPDEYTYPFDEIGGWCIDTNEPICKECKWASDEST